MTRKEEIESRKAEIREEVEATDNLEKVEELNKEVEALDEEAKQIDEQEKVQEEAAELEEKKFTAKEIVKEERETMNNKEFRNSKEYVDAFAEYVKSGMIKNYEMKPEQRALLTTNAENGIIEVPDLVDEVIRTAWQREDLMALVRSISVKGNFKVQFEVSGDPAVIHEEGGAAVTEEELVLGVKTLIAKSYKKWISVSDEAIDLKGEAFLRYVYDEITYKIAKKVADTLIAKIAALPQSLTANEDGVYDEVSAAKITEAPAIDTIVKATAKLSDEASNITIVMNRETDADFIAAQLANNYGVDVYRGYKVIYNNTLPAYSAATAGAVYAIVGDFANGALVNYPNGDGVEIKYDDKTLMTQDLVRILGRKFCAAEPVADKAFTLIAKPQA